MRTLPTLALATVFGLTAACGKIPVAGDDDSDGGADLPDAPAIGLATITVYDQGNPRAGATVIFHDPDGSVRGTVISDGGGMAIHEVLLGSLATVVLPNDFDNAARLYTVAGVDPGDEIDIGSKRKTVSDWVGSIEVFLPALPPMTAQYAEISIGSGCVSQFMDIGATGGSVVMDVHTPCLQPGDLVTVVAEATRDGVNGTERLAFSVTPVVLTNPGVPTPVSLPPWRNDWRRSDVTVTNAPAVASSANLVAEYYEQNALFDFDIGQLVLGGGDATLTGLFPKDVGDQFTLAAQVLLGSDPASPDGAGFLWANSSGAPPVSQEFDLGMLLPMITRVSYVAADSRPTISFDIDAGAEQADGLVVRIAYDRDANSRNEWLMTLPPIASSPIMYPELPASVAAFAPGLDANFDAPSMFLIDLASTDGYRAYKQINSSILDQQGLPKDTSGRVSLGGSFN